MVKSWDAHQKGPTWLGAKWTPPEWLAFWPTYKRKKANKGVKRADWWAKRRQPQLGLPGASPKILPRPAPATPEEAFPPKAPPAGGPRAPHAGPIPAATRIVGARAFESLVYV